MEDVRLPAKLVAEATAEAASNIADSLHAKVESGDLAPEPFWRVIQALLATAMQTLDAVYYLAAESQPKVFPPQAAMLIRALLENLGNLLALAEAPEERFHCYVQDSYRSVAEAYLWLQQRHSGDPAWSGTLRDYEAARAAEAEAIGLSSVESQNPGSLPRWPNPGALAGRVTRKHTFTLQGERGAVFGVIYDAWYANLSMIAHQRLPGIEKSVVAADPSPGERQQRASDILTSACFFLACILTEIRSMASLQAPPKLSEAWVYVKDRSHEMRLAYETRYQRLLAGEHEPA